MPIQYEYGLMFHTIDISHIEDISSVEGSSMFGQELADLTHGLNHSLLQFDGGDWEIMSHNINFSALVAMISFLIRRPAKLTEAGRSE